MSAPIIASLPRFRRIVIRGTNWLGDAVMSTPALLRLREALPDAYIAMFTHQKMRELWLHHPAVNETISFASGESTFSAAKKLRAGNFDTALILPNSPRSALDVWLAGIPHRIGYARPWRNWFLTQAIPTRPGHMGMHKRLVAEVKRAIASPNRKSKPDAPEVVAHQMYEYLHLVAQLGANSEPLRPQLFVAEEESESAKKKFGLERITNPIFSLNPGAEYGPAKRWPVERFIDATKEIQKRTNCLWLVLGGKSDAPLAAEIQSAIGTQHSAIDLAGKTSLRELMAVLKCSRMLLTNDTGPMHVAAALNTPVVVPFGSTSPDLTGPGLSNDPRHRLLRTDVSCSPCFLRECPIDFRCMNSIRVADVVDAVCAAASQFTQ